MSPFLKLDTRFAHKKLKAAGAMAAVLFVAACGPLISFGDDGPADDVYTLHYDGAIRSESPIGPIVYVDSPQMVEGLDGHGIAVRLDENRRTTLEGASWSSHLSELVRDYVTLSLGAMSDANMVSEGGLDIRAGCRIGTKVWAMEFVPGQTVSEDKVELTIQFSLVRLSDSELLSHPTFSETVQMNSSDGRGIVAAFETAMKSASNSYGRWFREESKACSS